jgi:hypothetical protein
VALVRCPLWSCIAANREGMRAARPQGDGEHDPDRGEPVAAPGDGLRASRSSGAPAREPTVPSFRASPSKRVSQARGLVLGTGCEPGRSSGAPAEGPLDPSFPCLLLCLRSSICSVHCSTTLAQIHICPHINFNPSRCL